MPLTIINAELTRELLPMSACVDAMEPAMIAATNGTVDVPPRMIAPLMDKSGLFALMPGDSVELNVVGAKVVSLLPGNPAKGIPAIQGFVTLFDHSTGAPLAIIDGAEVTGIRTAAASGLATRLLARADAKTCGILGASVQAVTHIDAMRAVRPVEEVIIWGRDFAKAEALAAEQAARTGINVRATDNPEEAAGCDLVNTVTGSPEPVLFGQWVKPGAHVNLVGAHTLTTREADTDLIAKSAVYVDLMASVKNEGGDVMIPVAEGAISESHILGEIGQLLQGQIAGRQNEEQITLYNSLGMTSQDLYAAQHVYRQALAMSKGIAVDF